MLLLIRRPSLGYDHKYWENSISEDLSYVQAATQAGHAVFSYDRLGISGSQRPDGIRVTQSATEVEIAHALIQHAKKDVRLFNSRFIGVGHSYGRCDTYILRIAINPDVCIDSSIQLVGLVAKYPDAVTGLVLTGFSVSSLFAPSAFLSMGLEMANTRSEFELYANDSSYLITQSSINVQTAFFYAPYFDPGL